MLEMETTLPAKVVAVQAGGTGPVGTVSIQPLVMQVTGNRKTYAHGVIPNVPYLRWQGGPNAVIIDPAIGDIGMAAFCSRDISAVKNARAQAQPGSDRHHSFSDAMYLGGALNGAPTRYIQFTDSGIVIVGAGTIQTTGTDITSTASGAHTIQGASATMAASGAAAVQGSSVSLGASGDTLHALIDERVKTWLASHTHTSAAAGSPTSAPNQALPACTTSTTKAG